MVCYGQRQIQGGERKARAPSFFTITCFFCNHFEELRTVLFEVGLIIINAPLTYVYPNTIETCLTPNHLLFGRQLLYSSSTTSAIVTNLTVLSSITDKITASVIICWIDGDMNLRETQRTSKSNIDCLKINVNDIVLVFL